MSTSRGFFRTVRSSEEVASFDDGTGLVTLLRYKPTAMSSSNIFQDSTDSGSGRSTPITRSPKEVKHVSTTFTNGSPNNQASTTTTTTTFRPHSTARDFYFSPVTPEPVITSKSTTSPEPSFATLEKTNKKLPPEPPTRALDTCKTAVISETVKTASESPTKALNAANTAETPIDSERIFRRPPRAKDSVRLSQAAAVAQPPKSVVDDAKTAPDQPPGAIETNKTASAEISEQISVQELAKGVTELTITSENIQTEVLVQPNGSHVHPNEENAHEHQHTWPVQTHRSSEGVSSFVGLANGRPISSCIYSSADNVSINDDYETQTFFSVMDKETNDVLNGHMKSSSLPDLVTESNNANQLEEQEHLQSENVIDSSVDSSFGDEGIKDSGLEGGSIKRPIATSVYSLPERNFSSLLRQRPEAAWSPPDKANTLSLKRGNKESKKSKKAHSYHELPNNFSKHSASHDDSIIVIFDAYGRHDTVEVFATEGYCLRDVLFGPLNLRELNLNDVSVFLRDSKTPLPLHLDCYPLGGRELYIREKMVQPQELSNMTINRDKRKSFGDPAAKSKDQPDASAHRQSVASFSFSTLELPKGASAGQKKMSMPPLTGKMLELHMQLQRYSTHGLPPIPLLLSMGMPQFDESVLTLDTHWTQFVDGAEKFTKRMRCQQDALWELFETEVKHIRNVKVIIDLFWCCLLDLQNLQILNEIETEKVCLNIAEVYAANYEWWQSFLLPVLTYARETQSPLNVPLVIEAFQQFEDLFLPYSRYCVEQAVCINYIRQQQRDNELFAAFLAWAQEQSQCCRLKLADFIIMPMQRLTKYQLLLREVLKNTEHEQLKTSLTNVTLRVEGFVTKINTAVYHSEQMILLKGTIDRIDAYDVVEIPSEDCSKIISDLSKFDLAAPMPGCSPYQHRYLLQEGRMKLKEANGKSDVYCFLFTDMLLITKTLHRRADKVKVIKPPMRLDQVVIQALADNSLCIVVLNDYRLATACYVLSGMPGVGISWLQPLLAAQTQYRSLRQKAFEASGEVALMQYLEEDYEDNVAVLNRTDRTDFHQSQASLQSSISRLSVGGSSVGHLPDNHSLSDSSSGSSEQGILRKRHFHTHSGSSVVDFIAEENEDELESPRSSTKRANSMPSVGTDLRDLKAAAANVVSRQPAATAVAAAHEADSVASSIGDLKSTDGQRSEGELTQGRNETRSPGTSFSDNNNRKSVLDKYIYDDDDGDKNENVNPTAALNVSASNSLVDGNDLHVDVNSDDKQEESTIDPSEYQMWTPAANPSVYRYEPTPNVGGVIKKEEPVDLTAVDVGGATGGDKQPVSQPTVILRHSEKEAGQEAAESVPEMQQHYRRSKTGAPYPPVKRKPTREEVAFIRKQILLNLKLDATEV